MKTYDTSMLTEQQAGGLSLDEAIKRGIEASEAGDKAGAGQIFRRVVTEYPDSLEAWIWLGWTSMNLDYSEAAFIRAAALAPSNEEAQLGLRWVASQRSSVPQAIQAQIPSQPPAEAEVLAEMQAGAPDTSTSLQASEVSEPPVEVPRQGVLPDDWNFDDVMRRAVRAAQMGDKPSAYVMFRQIVERHPDMPTVWVWCGGTSPSLEDAEAAFRRAQQLDPANEEATLGLRWVALRRKAMESGRPTSTPRYPSSTSTDNLTGSALPSISNQAQSTGGLTGPVAAANAESPSEESKSDKTLNPFMRFLKKLNIPLPVILLIVAIAVVWAIAAMVYLSGPTR